MIRKFDQEFQEKEPEDKKAFFEAANQEISDFIQEKQQNCWIRFCLLQAA